jgi:hypothetical protein
MCLPGVAQADSEAPPRDYKLVTGNGNYVFVMLVPSRLIQSLTWLNRELRNKYPSSGLYLNDGSNTPLWTVDWYAINTYISSDGKHLIRMGPWPVKGNYSEVALSFYENGEEIKNYEVKDLVATPETLPESTSHYGWLEESFFDDKVGRMYIKTVNQEKYVFDVTTGEIPADRPDTGGFLLLVSVVASGTFLLNLAAFLAIKIRKNRV